MFAFTKLRFPAAFISFAILTFWSWQPLSTVETASIRHAEDYCYQNVGFGMSLVTPHPVGTCQAICDQRILGLYKRTWKRGQFMCQEGRAKVRGYVEWFHNEPLVGAPCLCNYWFVYEEVMHGVAATISSCYHTLVAEYLKQSMKDLSDVGYIGLHKCGLKPGSPALNGYSNICSW